MSENSLSKLRTTTSRVLAAAVLDLCPGTELLGGKSTDLGFQYDFSMRDPVAQEMIPHLEERMHALLREGHPIKRMEMVPQNAAQLLKHHKHFHRAKAARASHLQLIQVFKMGNMVDYCIEPFQEEHSGAFKIQEMTYLDGLVRIKGTAFEDEQTLKKFLVFYKKNKHLEHMTLGQKLGLFKKTQEALYWLPKGEKLYQDLLLLVRRKYFEHGFQWVRAVGEPGRFYDISGIKKFVWNERLESADFSNLLKSESCLINRAFVLCEEKNHLKEMISFLQFIEEITKILNLKCDIPKDKKNLEKSVKITIDVEDLYGKKWPCFEIETHKTHVEFSAFKSLERLIGLIIESDQGRIPKEF